MEILEALAQRAAKTDVEVRGFRAGVTAVSGKAEIRADSGRRGGAS